MHFYCFLCCFLHQFSDPLEMAWGAGVADVAVIGSGGCTHYLEDVHIVASCVAHLHSVALSDDGRLFSWGCGSDGRTGLKAYMRGPVCIICNIRLIYGCHLMARLLYRRAAHVVP